MILLRYHVNVAAAAGGVKRPLSFGLRGVEDWSHAPGHLSDLRALAGENALVSILNMCLAEICAEVTAPSFFKPVQSDKMPLTAEFGFVF